MNERDLDKVAAVIGRSYAESAYSAAQARQAVFRDLLSQRRLPEAGVPQPQLREMVLALSLMDSNNFPGRVGVGEREGRLFRAGGGGLVEERSFGMAHGIGRSGDIAALQPKAAGSSLMSRLVHCFVKNLLKKECAIHSVREVLVLPLSTGMALSLVLLTLRRKRPAARFVVWPRIDQKTCLKCIFTAGFEPIVVENVRDGDMLRTDVAAVRALVALHGPEAILCVLSTTSCFAPRVPDKVVELAELCKEHGIPHVVNNAYGVQQSKCCSAIEQASRKGRVDCFVQSTDKNFLVPVGGAVVASGDKQLLADVSQTYPGRASAAPLLDLFLQLLSMGTAEYRRLLAARQVEFVYFREQLVAYADSIGERVLHTPLNQLSLAMTLDSFSEEPTMLGSMLFKRNVSGTRTIAKGVEKEIGGIKFVGYGSHCDAYPHHYLTVAAAIGVTREEIDVFLTRLDTSVKAYRKRHPHAP